MFTSSCGDIEWSTIGREPAVVGYNAGGDFYENHRSSGFDTIGFDVSCVIQLGQTKRQTKETNTMATEVGQNQQQVKKMTECQRDLMEDTSIFPDNEIEKFASMEACPCSLSHAQFDPRFQVDPVKINQNDVGNCYIQTLLTTGTATPPFGIYEYEYGEQCCYNEAGYAVL